MANILTAAEAADILRCETDDENMLLLLPQIDAHLEIATGRDWTLDNPISPLAKDPARILLVRGHEDPGALASPGALGWGLQAAIIRLKAKALELAAQGAPAEALALVSTNIDGDMAVDASFVLIFNHEMAVGAPDAVTLEDADGDEVAVTNALDVTGKILTVNPDADLDPEAAYTLVITDAADIYGQTFEQEIGFWTAEGEMSP